MEKASHSIYLALGANIGDRLAALKGAVEGLGAFVKVEKLSPVYETAPAYATDQPSFLNATLHGTTTLEPTRLLYAIKDLERELGRKPSFRYGPRAIDIDILFYDDRVLHTPELNVPHALMQERIFVLKPLADIAADFVHPGLHVTVKELLDHLPDQSGAWPYGLSL